MYTIALIDDEELQRGLLRELLTDLGHKVVAEGASAAEALTICKAFSPEVVLMDVSMPGADGIEAAARIRDECPTPVILLTALEDNDTITRAVEAGVMGYLVKPAKMEDIQPAIVLAKKRFFEVKSLESENQDLRHTIETRKIVEKAKGLLMRKEKLSEEEAFKRLRKLSMDRRKTLKDISEVVIALFGG